MRYGGRATIKTSDLDIRDRLYIDGQWRAPADGIELRDVVDSRTEQVMGRIATAGAHDVVRAVAAARAATAGWAETTPMERADFLSRIATGLEARQDVLAETIAREVGTPTQIGLNVQVGLAVTFLRAQAQLLESYRFEEELESSLVIKQPVGVVACITPWNFPLNQMVSKVSSALAAGCTTVVKPSSEAPLSLYSLAEVVDEVGLPAGVFNLIAGPGATTGEALALEADVDMVSFTGSTDVGQRIGVLAARGIKRLALELGGKSPNVILDDANVDQAVADGLARAFLNSGQTCSALTRMLVPRVQIDEFEAAAVEAAQRFTVGDPLDAHTQIGPLVSARQRNAVRAYIQSGITAGAKLLLGGAETPAGFETGYYVKPTIFSAVSNDMKIAREEIFGPVLTIIPYQDEADAVRIANDTIFGLAAGVWSGDRDRAIAVGRRLLAGQVNINGGAFNPHAPFGGFKQSGHGRERGKFGLEEFLEVKSLQL